METLIDKKRRTEMRELKYSKKQTKEVITVKQFFEVLNRVLDEPTKKRFKEELEKLYPKR